MASEFIIDVYEHNFDYEVIAYSQNTPVLVDFWAAWCQPCKILTPMLEELTEAANGSFRLARVDADANPVLTMRYGVRSIPSVKAFKGGQVVAEFAGLQPIDRIRAFIEHILPPTQLALSLEKGASLLGTREWSEAEDVFRELHGQDASIPPVNLGLVRALLAQGKAAEAAPLLRAFPASREFSVAEKLNPLAEMLNRFDRNELPEEDDLDLLFTASMRMASRGNLEGAMDGMMEILRHDKTWRSGRARQVLLALLEIYNPADPTARQYRNELSAVLF